MIGGAGRDVLYGQAGNDSLVGNANDDELHGGDGDDVLEAGDGTDRLYGDNGNDKLNGGRDFDVQYGGAPPPRPKKNAKGRPRVKGQKLPSPQEVVQKTKKRKQLTVNWYDGRSRRVEVVTGTGHWYQSGEGLVEILWVFVHDLTGSDAITLVRRDLWRRWIFATPAFKLVMQKLTPSQKRQLTNTLTLAT